MKTGKYFFALLLTLASIVSYAQSDVPMADALRSEGKIYVVVAIMLVILLGIAGYLFTIDRKVSKLEKRLPNKKS